MKFEFFIAKRIFRNKETGQKMSKPAVLIAMAGIAVGLAIMLISISIIIGFKKEVKQKVFGFSSHLHIMNFDAIGSYETSPIVYSDSLAVFLEKSDELKHIQRYSTKPGMIKTTSDFQGVVFKGIGQEYDLEFLRSNLVEGEIPDFSDDIGSNQIVISKNLALKLGVSLGERLYSYFIQDQIRVRRFLVAGIYETNFSDFDKYFILTDIYTVNRLNKWGVNQVSGLELELKNYSLLPQVTTYFAETLNGVEDGFGGRYYVQNIEEINPQVFAWLDLLDLNVWVILGLMLGVAGFTMISGLLIIMIERTSMIGLLKALGASNRKIRKVFLWLAFFLVGRGMFWGNVIGLGFYFIQDTWHLFKLDPSTYYVDTVPVNLNILVFILVNVGTLIASLLMLIGPTYLITKIAPASSMKYE